MAAFDMVLPTELIKDFEKIYNNSGEIFAAMTKAGAEVVRNNIRTNAPAAFKSSEIMSCLRITRSYKTPTDDGINTKVGFYGYFTNHKGVKTPAPLVANVFEYGKKGFAKRPFLRKSFRAEQIRAAMLKAQKEASGGRLDE